MITRMTTSMMANTSLATIQKNFSRLADANRQMASGKRMEFPSDDPASSVSSMRLRKELAATQQYQRNIDDAAAWMQTADSAMQSVSGQYTKAKSTLINSINSANGPASLKALGQDLRQQAQAIMSQANATYLGRAVFAGNSDKGAVFKVGTSADGKSEVFLQLETDDVTAKPVNRRINADTTLPANMDGNSLFGTGTINWAPDAATGTTIDTTNNPSVMNLLVEAANIMESPDGLSSADPDKKAVAHNRIMAIQAELDRRAEGLHEGMSTLGARHKQVLQARETVLADIQNVKSQISGVEDIDIQSATVEMSLASMAYQASLGSTQRVVQPSLLDYLR
ncbi:MAG: flagellin [Mobiluncus porci]|uniref:flagellin N-terminal helical domain-containing protein n=1 Tax=Mobiluncus TaxID=2050 RepID=UPI0023F29390|nr:MULTISPECIES: flagellin [Mobiluncus]MCI6584689.1 flagellar hook-associated protein 3 [Mobiluncus sp.]MDD7541004.1 flagellin [Mobiluncus porci]MDY5748179.1 flagellin [Mobiluncus porci]